ncbi:MAG: hypothetical protein ABFD58_09560 [Anaerolineaceae bacterium]
MKRTFKYERHSQPLLPWRQFLRRLLGHGLVAFLLLFLSLSIGICGYHFTENLGWLDSLLNAAMILGGMGLVNALQTDTGKIFASFYALFSGIAFLASSGILITPIVHRFLHHLHLEASDQKSD